MTKICLIRHGQTDWNKQLLIQGRIDNPLNEEGKESTKKSLETIKNLNTNWDVFLSSPLLRAYQTAQIIKSCLNFPQDIIIIPNLTERDFGELEGKKVCQESYELMRQNVKGLESLEDLQKRALSTIINISKKYPNKNILITTHSQFIKGLLSALIEDFDFTYPLKNNSLTLLEVNEEKIKVIKYDVI